MKAIFLIIVVSVTAIVSIVTIVNREEREAEVSSPEPKASITPDLGSRDAEMVVTLYIKAAQENNEKALLGYIADLDTLPHRQRNNDPQPSPEADVEDIRVGRRLLDLVDEVGHDLLPKDEPQYIRNLGLVVEKIESKCSTPIKCRVRAFFERFENREIVHDFIVYQIDGIGWKIVSVLPATEW
jgi:hypothetical protein